MRKVINCLKEDNPIIQKKLRRVTLEEGKKNCNGAIRNT